MEDFGIPKSQNLFVISDLAFWVVSCFLQETGGLRMATKRSAESASGVLNQLKPLKPVRGFDDSSIRKLLRSAYYDSVGSHLESQMNPLARLIISNANNLDSRIGLDLAQLSNKAELNLFWDMFIQKQILIFEEETNLLLNFEKDDW